MEQEKVKPIFIKDPETNEVKFTLEFNRKTVKQAERSGFKLDEVADYPMTKPAELFYHAMKMHQPWMTPERADQIFCELGGIACEGLVSRLVDLYNEPFRAMQDEAEKNEKNGKVYALEL